MSINSHHHRRSRHIHNHDNKALQHQSKTRIYDKSCLHFLKIIIFINAMNIIATLGTVLCTINYIFPTNWTNHTPPQILINTNPNIQTTIPIIWRMETFSLYKKYPTIKRTHARPMFATTLAVLTCQPAR